MTLSRHLEFEIVSTSSDHVVNPTTTVIRYSLARCRKHMLAGVSLRVAVARLPGDRPHKAVLPVAQVVRVCHDTGGKTSRAGEIPGRFRKVTRLRYMLGSMRRTLMLAQSGVKRHGHAVQV